MREVDYKKYKILLVDDELNNLENLIFAFELDYNLISASSANEALDIVDREDIAVIISDQRMPEVNGIELLCKIKKKKPDIIRILITAYSDLEAVIDGINKGDIYRFIKKDWSIDEIEIIIKQAIEYYQMKNDLEAATQALIKSEKLATIAEIAAGIEHELKNTLMGASLGVESVLLTLRDKGIDDPDISKRLGTTMEYCKRSNEIIGRLNDFAKPGHIEKVNLVKVIDDSIDMARDVLKKILTNITISKQLGNKLPLVEGNAVLFEQIFFNLIRNACQAMELDGGDIIIKGTADDNWVYISVKDTGPGIETEIQKSVFEPFFTTKKEGMGMGLYIINNIAKTFEGRLELESPIGDGCTFTVCLPVIENA